MLMLKGFNILLAPGAFPLLSFHYFGGYALFFLPFCFKCVILYLQHISADGLAASTEPRGLYIVFSLDAPAFIVGVFFYLLLGLNRPSFCFWFPYKLVKSIRLALLCSDSNGFFEYCTSLKYDSFRLLMQNLYKKSFVCIDKFVNCAIIEA